AGAAGSAAAAGGVVLAGAAFAGGAGATNAGGGGSNDFFCGSGGRYGSAWRGRVAVTPAEPFGRISGVIMTTSSVWSFCAALLRNRRPRMGMSPRPGIFCIDVIIELLSRPAIANV